MTAVTEASPGIYRIEAPLGDRYVALYLLRGETRAMLIDTGVEGSVQDHVLPALETLGLDPSMIRYALNTHSDFDHVGGNEALKEAVPDVVLMSGELDRPLIDDLSRMIAERYGEFAHEHGFDDTD